MFVVTRLGPPILGAEAFVGNSYRSAVCRLTCGMTLAVILFLAASVAAARSITFNWDPNPEPDVRGKATSFVNADAVDNPSYYFFAAAHAVEPPPGPRLQGNTLTRGDVRSMAGAAVTEAGGER
jgi:hypothetical protein